mgnify:CR=1 FL=1
MDKKERIKIQIGKLQAQSDYQKFEFGQYSVYYIGLLAILIAVFIPIIIDMANKDLILTVGLAVLLLVLCLVAYKVIHIFSNKNLKKIKDLSSEIDKLYGELLK